MIPDRLQYFLDDFWNDQKCDQIWTLGPCIYHQNASTNTGKYGNDLDKYYFSYLTIWNCDFVEGMRTQLLKFIMLYF